MFSIHKIHSLKNLPTQTIFSGMLLPLRYEDTKGKGIHSLTHVNKLASIYPWPTVQKSGFSMWPVSVFTLSQTRKQTIKMIHVEISLSAKLQGADISCSSMQLFNVTPESLEQRCRVQSWHDPWSHSISINEKYTKVKLTRIIL